MMVSVLLNAIVVVVVTIITIILVVVVVAFVVFSNDAPIRHGRESIERTVGRAE